MIVNLLYAKLIIINIISLFRTTPYDTGGDRSSTAAVLDWRRSLASHIDVGPPQNFGLLFTGDRTLPFPIVDLFLFSFLFFSFFFLGAGESGHLSL